ncbi:hypothetical protein [Linepithema humile polycipivirus 1]|nr:hypothetical protein [Linepithema humile polycipivirus 1]
MNAVGFQYGGPSTSGSVEFTNAGRALSGGGHTASDFFRSIPSLQNQYGLSFFGTSNHYPSLTNDWQRIERTVSENAAAQTGIQSTSAASETEELATTLNGALSESAATTVGELTGSAEEVEGIAEGAAVESGVGTPFALAAIVNQQLGEGYVRAQSADTENQIAHDSASNATQHGLNVALDASIIRNNQEATRQNIESAGLAGSLFGLPGALIGQALASTVSADPNSSILNTASSFEGMYNPSDTNAVASATTADLSGQSNLVDNVTS